MADADDDRLRIMHGGAFYELMNRLGIRNRGWRAFVLASLCWATPIVFLLATRGGHGAALFLSDWGAWAKFLIAPALLTLTEKPISVSLDKCMCLLLRTPLVASQSITNAKEALQDARVRTTALVPELACLLVAIAASAFNASNLLDGTGPAWAVSDGGTSLAGLWSVSIGNTIYWFLLTRLMWKHVVWGRLLHTIGRCRLRLTVTHPDGHGGLGLLGSYSAGSALFTLAVSSVLAAGVGHVMQRQAVTPTLFTTVCAGWLALVAIYFALPLAPLEVQLARLKRQSVLLSVAKLTDAERAAERKALGTNVFEDEAEQEFQGNEPRDAKPVYLASVKTSALIMDKKIILPVLWPALLPLLLVGASYLPYSELGPIAKRLLFL